MDTEKNLVNNPSFEGSTDKPEKWSFNSPRPEIAALGRITESEDGRMLRISGNGDINAFSWWQGVCDLAPGKWYRCSIMCRVTNVEYPQLSLFAQVAGHYMRLLGKVGDIYEFGCEFNHHRPQDGSDIELYFRCSASGTAEWFEPSVVEIPEPAHRIVRVATTRFDYKQRLLSMEQQREQIALMLDDAASVNPDIVCLMEHCVLEGVDRTTCPTYMDVAETIPDGPASRLISEKAAAHRMYIIAGLIERRDNHIYNTAAIFGRDGELVGKYDKTHPTFLEMKDGVSSGSDYPVFDLDFGRIAVQICYDEWFPEVTRLQAHQGAEMVFLLVMGGKPIMWRTRAMDNNVYYISSSTTPPSMIIDSSGIILAETHSRGFVFADLNLDVRNVNWYVDPTLTDGMPGIEPAMRNTLDNKCLSELSELIYDRE